MRRPTDTTKKTVRKPARALARVGDPYVAPNGEVIEDEKSKQSGVSSTTVDPALFRAAKKRTAKDLPATPSVLNAVSVVFMYTMLGLGDREIGDLLSTSQSEINILRGHTAYAECFKAVHAEFINSNSDLLTSRIAAYSQEALTTVGTLARDAKKEETRLSASRDILDRAGVRPKDQEGRSASVKNELRIIIVDNEAKITVSPIITVEGNEDDLR